MEPFDLLNKFTRGFLLLCAMAAGTAPAGAQIIHTYAGNGIMGYSGDGAAATAAKLNQPIGVAFDGSGNLYIADVGNSRIRIINAPGVITTFAGSGLVGYSGDGGAATSAKFMGMAGIAIDGPGNVYITDGGNNCIRKINTSGIITTIAGMGASGYSGDGGPATAARIANPKGLAVDGAGCVYIADYNNSVIRQIDSVGIIHTFAGTGTPGYSGDAGPATAAELNYPYSVTVDKTGNVYIADFGNYRVRKVDPSGIISTFAGGGSIYPGDGHPATAATLAGPSAVVTDKWGNVYIADVGSSHTSTTRTWIVDTFGIIYTIAGNGTAGYSGDGGPATAAEMNQPAGLALDGCGNVYIADLNNNRVRDVTYPPVYTTPTISLSGTNSAPAGATVTVSATVSSAGSSYDIYWYNNGVLFATTTTPATAYTKGLGTDTITALIVPTSYGCYDSITSAPHFVSNASLGMGNMNGENVVVWPNPAGMSVSVGVNGRMAAGEVTVYNLVGKAVINEALKSKETTLNISGLATGVYIVMVTDDAGKRLVGRLVKE